MNLLTSRICFRLLSNQLTLYSSHCGRTKLTRVNNVTTQMVELVMSMRSAFFSHWFPDVRKLTAKNFAQMSQHA